MWENQIREFLTATFAAINLQRRKLQKHELVSSKHFKLKGKPKSQKYEKQEMTHKLL